MQLDYYGKQLASAGSDRRIKVFGVGADGVQHQQTAELVGHDGPVWQLAWAHPEFGNILASCSYDRQVWRPLPRWLARMRRLPPGRQCATILASCLFALPYPRQVFVWNEHSPQQWGLLHKFFGHEGSVNSIGWAPKEFGLRYDQCPYARLPLLAQMSTCPRPHVTAPPISPGSRAHHLMKACRF